jgi:NAD(P)-dependent dehydrogenase (short-subunit alcohol dehydrogenase family)
MYTEDFSNQVVLITGASSGIGLTTALAFAEHGAKVAMLARNEARLQKAAAEVAGVSSPSNVMTISCDIRDESSVQNAFVSLLDNFGELQIVVNNAGTIRTASVADTNMKIWNEMIDVHCTGYFLVAREAVRTFQMKGEGGVMVFVVSDNAVRVSSGLLAYNVAKAAELHMARCIADECGPQGIRVNSILPGAVFGRSNFWSREFREARAAVHGYDPDHLEQEYKKGVALREIIFPEEVTELILFLASSRSSKITGAVVSIDAGGKSGYVR